MPRETFGPFTSSEGEKTNPTTSTLLADTGALPKSKYRFILIMGSSVDSKMVVQHRNAANDAIVSTNIEFRVRPQTGEYMVEYSLDDGERVRILPFATITGTAEAAIQASRIG